MIIVITQSVKQSPYKIKRRYGSGGTIKLYYLKPSWTELIDAYKCSICENECKEHIVELRI